MIAPFISIRTKLLFVAASLLIIPWFGYRYVQEMNSYLRHTQEQSLLERARIVAAVLAEHPELFPEFTQVENTPGDHLYVRSLPTPIQLDGYTDEWQLVEDRRVALDDQHVIFWPNRAVPMTLGVTVTAGRYGEDIFLLFEVADDKVVYSKPGGRKTNLGDNIVLAITHPDSETVRYVLSTPSPGWVSVVSQHTSSERELRHPSDDGVHAVWQATKTGYVVEVRIPRTIIGAYLGYAIYDVDDATTSVVNSGIGTIERPNSAGLGSITVPSIDLEALLDRIKLPSTRTWVLDRHSRVVAVTGRLTENEEIPDVNATPVEGARQNTIPQHISIPQALQRLFFRLLLDQPTLGFRDDLSTASRLVGDEIDAALEGMPATRWRQTSDSRVNILTAAYPIKLNDSMLGVAAIEETSNSILVLQNRAMEILISLGIITFMVASAALLLFSARLLHRIRRLRNDTEHAIGPDGRIHAEITRYDAHDELGELRISFSQLVDRLASYNRYLESMSGKLSHELRTPIAVVKSSLENLLSHQTDDEMRTFLNRAQSGVDRLNNILTRISEATRLERSLDKEPRSDFDLVPVVVGCVEGYRIAHPGVTFELTVVDGEHHAPITVSGSPDLIAQMLDKVIENAIDFHAPETPIKVTLKKSTQEAKLTISNEGPPLPSEMTADIFGSLVSVRKAHTEGVHLGLGLYIVRLVVDFHHGCTTARNLAENAGVEFEISLPIKPQATHPAAVR